MGPYENPLRRRIVRVDVLEDGDVIEPLRHAAGDVSAPAARRKRAGLETETRRPRDGNALAARRKRAGLETVTPVRPLVYDTSQRAARRTLPQ
ncbi:hypothetical protein [Natrinema halophilum]|uniref:Uncharacterized protein n=1 Tax=Natrinema halophilum TaxID=1699371 RepID=A0A7D5GJ52_9EURY|nr:hypothetical protein [Natrinema halophilum]QLG48090.1 hypothetical protein HYG82_04130 [Natrinema halophilum]